MTHFSSSHQPQSASALATSEPKLCYYCNESAHIQILRLSNGMDWEKIVFPLQKLLFWADPSVDLKVYTCGPGTAPLQLIPCVILLANDGEE